MSELVGLLHSCIEESGATPSPSSRTGARRSARLARRRVSESLLDTVGDKAERGLADLVERVLNVLVVSLIFS